MERTASLPLETRLAGALLVAFAVHLVWDLHTWWDINQEYLFGFLAPLFAAYITYDRWPRLMGLLGASNPNPATGLQVLRTRTVSEGWRPVLNFLALTVIILCGLGFSFGVFIRAMEGLNPISSNLFAYSFGGFLLSSAYLFTSKGFEGRPVPLTNRVRFAALFLFPALVWIIATPPVSAVWNTILLTLQEWVVVIVFNLFDALGFAIVREGSVLQLPTGMVGVEDACSGIRSLMACLFAGSFLAAAFLDRLWKKVALLVAAMLSAFTLNVIRSLILTGLAYAHGPSYLDEHIHFLVDLGNVHDLTGNAVLVVTLAALLALVGLFSLRLEYELPPPKDDLQAGASASA